MRWKTHRFLDNNSLFWYSILKAFSRLFNFFCISMTLLIEENHWLSWCNNGKPFCHWIINVGGRPDSLTGPPDSLTSSRASLTGPRDRLVSKQKPPMTCIQNPVAGLHNSEWHFCHLFCSLADIWLKCMSGKRLAGKPAWMRTKQKYTQTQK